MKDFVYTLLLLISLSACTQDTYTVDKGGENPSYHGLICFTQDGNGSFVDAHTVTKGSHTGIGDISSYGVSCSAYPKGEDYSASACGSYFFNVNISAENGQSGYYWPGEEFNLSFFAYTPCDNPHVYLQSQTSDLGDPQYRYVVPEAVNEQVDFMTCNVYNHEGISFSPVPLVFLHRCAEIKFSATNNTPEELVLKSVSVVGVKYDGTLTGENWSVNGEANSLTRHPFTISPELNVAGTETVDVTGSDLHFIMIPQTISKGTAFIVVKTMEQGEERTYQYTLSEELVLSQGKSYRYKLIIGYKTLEVEQIEIVPWNEEDEMTGDVEAVLKAHTRAVDMGLSSGLLWAAGNVGAADETEPGLYFAWGETIGHEKGSGYSFSSVNYNAGSAASISANLTLNQDAAHACLGGNWRMPTADDFQELINGCNTTWVTDYKNTGVNGRLFTSKTNGNTLFFPAAGRYDDTLLKNWGSSGNVWSSTFYSSSSAYGLVIGSSNCNTIYNSRDCGYSVRGVWPVD